MLEVEDLHAYYGKSHILQGVTFAVRAGEIVSLLGRNGVGRSTVVKTIMGLVPPVGSITFRKERIDGLPPHVIARKGLGYVPEDREIFPGLTVRENLLLGVKSGGTRPPATAGNRAVSVPDNEAARTAERGDALSSAAASRARWTFEDVFALFPLLRERIDAPGGVLSGGEQQMLTICRTLMGDPALIMVDEPTEGLSPQMVEQVRRLLERIAERGVAILLIEQKLTIALAISHRLYVMGQGRVVFEGSARDLRDNHGVRKEWLEV